MKKLIIGFILVLMVPVPSQAAFQFLSEEIRNTYMPLVREICHSFTLEEASGGANILDIPYADVRLMYHEVMACVFETAIVDATNETNKDFEEIFTILGTGYVPKDRALIGPCGGLHFQETVYKKQEELGYKTLCLREDNEKALVNKPYSSCHISEIAFNEFCGYQEFLDWKAYDRSLKTEFDLLTEGTSQGLGDSNSFREAQKDIMSKEAQRSFRIMEETLQQYHEFVQSYRLHLWKVVMIETLKLVQSKSSLVQNAFEIWYVKFYNAASKYPDQR